MKALCKPESAIDFTCVCETGFSLAVNGTKCLRNCDSSHLIHGEIKGNQICLDGEMKNNNCKVEGQTLTNGEKISMIDGTERFCDHGTMKPKICE